MNKTDSIILKLNFHFKKITRCGKNTNEEKNYKQLKLTLACPVETWNLNKRSRRASLVIAWYYYGMSCYTLDNIL